MVIGENSPAPDTGPMANKTGNMFTIASIVPPSDEFPVGANIVSFKGNLLAPALF
jgi:hypothetical protein